MVDTTGEQLCASTIYHRDQVRGSSSPRHGASYAAGNFREEDGGEYKRKKWKRREPI